MPGNGLVVVDKPAGITSHDVVARVRRLAGTRKVGHAGTLDPMATGVLVVGINRATRLLGHLLLTDKAYDAVVRLGASTSTDDAEGETIASAPAGEVPEDAIRAGLAAMVGEIDQVPSAVSAIKIDGKRAYERVRAGEDVRIAARRVRIDAIEVTGIERTDDHVDVAISVRCSSGTYIRAIARDLGEALGVGGHLTVLRRTAVGEFGLDDARTLDQLADELAVVDIADAARASFPAYELDDVQAAMVRVGKKLPIDLPSAGPVAVFAPGGEFLALYERAGTGPGDLARPIAVFV
ncbi:tRNA pseudouridine(55) synthase TruB [Nocardioides marmoriginsengisoli]|uniref:tRNA pseudouridine synthase B n=1 Tax=Nocardioides marmoriginsengisoli TaxID=661483 RepID=A0A3N0CPU6_9ACTN|nr:tRNA pseudouridine(55) synthase TruB [Nocardioides marmoriginsengisoli]